MRYFTMLVTGLLAATAPIEAQAPLLDSRAVTMPIDALAVTREGIVRGTVTARCTAAGTTLGFTLGGLVPRGTYSLWVFVFGVSRDAITSADATAAGALGSGDGRSHEFLADAQGRAELLIVQPRGRLSAFGHVRDCLLDEPQWRVVGAHHPRRVTAGTRRPPSGEIVEHFGARSTAAGLLSTN